MSVDARLRKRFAGGKASAPFELDLHLRTDAGVTVLFGPSGAGKTLALDCITGFVRPDEGRILVDDVLLFDAAARLSLPVQKRRCGYVFQNYALFPNMTLRENLLFGAAKMAKLERLRRVDETLERFRIADVAGRYPQELSGGQKQRGSIARALLSQPRILLLDEPARGLDAPLRAELYAVISEVRRDYGTPVLLVTHDVEEALALGDWMVVLEGGRIIQSGTPISVVDQPASATVARLLGCENILQAEIVGLNPGRDESRLKVNGGETDFEIHTAYLPGHLLGARVTLCAKPSDLRAAPMPAAGVPLALVRASEGTRSVRLEFEGGVAVDVTRDEFERYRGSKDWAVEFPRDTIRLMKP